MMTHAITASILMHILHGCHTPGAWGAYAKRIGDNFCHTEQFRTVREQLGNSYPIPCFCLRSMTIPAMATHLHGPADPDNPIKNRHTVARLHDENHRPTKQLELVQRDALRVIDWLGESPLRTITSEELRKWVRSQTPAWTPGYWKVVRDYVQDGLADRVSESATTTKARLLALVDRLLPECSQYVTGNGGAGEGTIFLTDPVTGEHLKKIEHGAIQGYLKFYAELTGLLSEKHQHVHLHGALASGDLSEVPESELIAAMNAKPAARDDE